MENGEFMTRIDIAMVLGKHYENIIDYSQMFTRIYAINSLYFLLQIENYFFIFTLYFDKNQQNYKVRFLKNEFGQRYFKRISKCIDFKLIKFFKDFKGNLFISTENKIKMLDAPFEQIHIQDFLGETIHYKFFFKSKESQPFHHPEFLFSLLGMGYFDIVENIFLAARQSITMKGYVILLLT